MSLLEDEIQITPLVRRYSEQIVSAGVNSPIEEVLVDTVEYQKNIEEASQEKLRFWREWLRHGKIDKAPVEDQLEKHGQAMIKEWRKISKDKGTGTSPFESVAYASIPTIEDLSKAVNTAQVEYEKKGMKGFHKVLKQFGKFSSGLQYYNALAGLIPSGDKYACLITGVISSVVKVSATHDKAAEAFSESLAQLSDTMYNINLDLKRCQNSRMQSLVVELYVEVFQFLCHALKWYSSGFTRVIRSLHTSYVDDEIENYLRKIRSIEQNISKLGQSASQDTIEETGSDVKNIKSHVHRLEYQLENRFNDMDSKMQTVLDQISGPISNGPERLLELGTSSSRRAGSIEDAHRELRKLFAGMSAAQLLDAVAEHRIWSTDSASSPPLMIQANTDGPTRGPRESRGVSPSGIPGFPDSNLADLDVNISNVQHRSDIVAASLSLQVFADDGREAVLDTRTGLLPYFPEEALTKLRDWTQITESSFVWIEGPAEAVVSGISIAASQICNLALKSGIPYISYFCPLDFKAEASKGLTKPQAGIIALLYSSIVQLVQLLPEEFVCHTQLTESRFRQLDRSFASGEIALDIIEDLLATTDDMMHWILDGINLVENRDTRPLLARLIKILRQHGKKSTCKVCFLTNGSSIVLSQSLRVAEMVDATRPFLPGQGIRGGIDASILGEYI